MPVDPNKTQWTDDRLAVLKDCIDRKQSVGDAANLLHTTRGACSGKAHRMGWKFHSTSNHATRTGHVKPKRRPPFRLSAPNVDSVVEQPLPSNAPLSLDLTIYELTGHTCKYPYGDNPPMLFCGHPVEGESPYCSFHHRLCCGPPPPLRGKMALRPFR